MNPMVYLVSDLHLGQGKDLKTGKWHVLEDFRVDEAFCAFIDHISGEGKPAELIIAGDFIEYLQILPSLGLQSPEDHLGVTERESLQRTLVVLGQSDIAYGHPTVFARLRKFIHDGHMLTILVGNHDIDLLWPRVWALMYYNLCPPGTKDKLRLIPFSYTIGKGNHSRIYIEHGHEHDRANAFGDQMSQPFGYDRKGVQRLKRCWGSLFVDKVYNQLEEQCWFIDNIKPIWRVIKLGLRGNVTFTATAMALMAKFFLTEGMPFVSFHVPGSSGSTTNQRNAEMAIQSVQDHELRAYMQECICKDATFRSRFEQEIQKFSADEEQGMREMKAQAEQYIWDEAPVSAQSFGIFSPDSDEDTFQKVARKVLEQDPSIGTVIMGHTHMRINRSHLKLTNGRTGYYFNSGTWAPHLIERDMPYTWKELSNPNNYIASLDYLRFTPDNHGVYEVELRSWQKDNIKR